jgi:hypothetical protein
MEGSEKPEGNKGGRKAKRNKQENRFTWKKSMDLMSSARRRVAAFGVVELMKLTNTHTHTQKRRQRGLPGTSFRYFSVCCVVHDSFFYVAMNFQ